MTSTSSSSSSMILWTAAAAAAVASLATYMTVSAYFEKRQQALARIWQERRQEERTGRIRAEVRLRTAIKEQKRNNNNTTSSGHKDKNTIPSSQLHHVIGTVVSPYTKRMGTPRQPQLVPSSRGFIAFDKTVIAAASLDGITEYSHIWILFEFHANTNVSNRKTKIRPPRATTNGTTCTIKVGQLATRSPHRPNAIGLSLVKLEQWDAKALKLHISGLDLVTGTPVYDIKPVVPWDVPGYFQSYQQQQQQTKSDNNLEAAAPPITIVLNDVLRVPAWVEQDDAIANVEFSEKAAQQLKDLVAQGRLAPLYTTNANDDANDDDNDDDNDGYAAAMQTLKEVLAQDPRSSHKGVVVNARGSNVSKSNNNNNNNNSNDDGDCTYSLIFCACQVHFLVLPDKVQVTKVLAVDFDESAYVDGIPLISEATTTTTTTTTTTAAAAAAAEATY